MPRSRSRDRRYRGRRGSSRSRSRSGGRSGRPYNRDISTSRERSRDRERRRRRAQAECIRRAGGFQKLADSEGREPVRLFWDGFQWVAKTGHSQTLQNDPALMNSTRKLRRLYFGNLPLHLGLTETGFQDIVWQEMKARNFCSNPDENPVLYVWFAKDKGNYGFVEFASVEETERALTMDGMNCMGIPLKVSRPNDYSTTSTQQSQAMALMGQQAAQMLQGGAAAAGLGGLAPPPPPGPPPGVAPGITTRFIRINQIVLPEAIEEEEEFQDILEDVKEGCGQHGKILNGVIITPSLKDQVPYNVGDVVLEFSEPSGTDLCVKNMCGRRYEGRPISITRMEEEEFNSKVRPLLSSS